MNSLRSNDDCLICTDQIQVFAIGKCNHLNVCFECTFRNRMLYGKRDCPICREENDVVILTKEPKKFLELSTIKYSFNFKDVGIKTNDFNVFKYFQQLTTPQCKYCSKKFMNKDDLNEHYKYSHNMSFCPICMKDQKVFVNELKLYTEEQLYQHCNEIIKETGLKRHPMCDFCDKAFIDLDSLYSHLNTKHEHCYICKKKYGSMDYFNTYDDLVNHFKQHHFVCSHKDCTMKYAAFDTLEELQWHTICCHKCQKKVKVDPSLIFNEQQDHCNVQVTTKKGKSIRFFQERFSKKLE
ncbi:hypothetical protein QTN25_005061 [Entamoeba marina]